MVSRTNEGGAGDERSTVNSSSTENGQLDLKWADKGKRVIRSSQDAYAAECGEDGNGLERLLPLYYKSGSMMQTAKSIVGNLNFRSKTALIQPAVTQRTGWLLGTLVAGGPKKPDLNWALVGSSHSPLGPWLA